jgi:hypothetical protein
MRAFAKFDQRCSALCLSTGIVDPGTRGSFSDDPLLGLPAQEHGRAGGTHSKNAATIEPIRTCMAATNLP